MTYLSSQPKNSRFQTTEFCGLNTWCASYFLAGCHQKRFKAFIAHCGIFNFESMYGQTEELFFINHDYGGAYWEKDNPTSHSCPNEGTPRRLGATTT